jgi:hypothetical protein
MTVTVTFKHKPVPAITSLSPGSGTIGTTVTITGTHFGASQGTSTVSFNGTTAAVTSWTDQAITCTVPLGATTGPVRVTTLTGTSADMTFKIKPPAITALDPPSGTIGATVIIHGKRFGPSQGTSTVSFNGTTATVSSWSDKAITCTVPDGAATGPLTVTTSVGTSKGIAFTIESR